MNTDRTRSPTPSAPSRKSHTISAARAVRAAWRAASVCSIPSLKKGQELIAMTDPNFFAGMTCVNVRMLDGVDLKSVKIKFADGKSYKQEE
tara:strand:- start:439 stop:711 length:273 start_codon:yes stop_codon:yes gene_type:complete